MIVADVMSTPARYATPQMHAKEALEMLDAASITALPVVSDDRVVGIVSEIDLIRGVVRPDLGHHVHRLPPETEAAPVVTVASVMRPDPVSVYVDTDLAAAVAQMEEHLVKSLPVLDHHGHLCGMVSRRDIVRVLATSDAQLTLELEERLASKSDWSVDVTDGVAHVHGPRSASERAFARATAYLTPGLMEVVID